jgi:hypothetical protein
MARCWVSVPSDYFVRTKCQGRFSSHVVAPDTSLAVVCGGWRPQPTWRSSLADLSRGLSAAEVAGGQSGVGGGLAAVADDFRPSAPSGVDLGSSGRRSCCVGQGVTTSVSLVG